MRLKEMECQKCNRNFAEEFLEESHDIPKYIGGTDLDGRHWLCKECHEKYELTILIKILKFLNEDFFLEEKILWMKELSKQPKELKKQFKKIAQEVKEEFFEYG